MSIEGKTFTLEPIKLVKLLRSIKISNKVYFKIVDNRIEIKLIDLKEYLGLIELEIDISQNKLKDDKRIALELDLFLNILDNFKNPVLITLDEAEAKLTVRQLNDKAKRSYTMPYEASAQVNNILSLEVLESPIFNSKFKTKAGYIREVLKSVTTIDLNLKVNFVKTKAQDYQLLIYANQSDSLYQDLHKKNESEIYDMQVKSKASLEGYAFYFKNTYYLNFLKLLHEKSQLNWEFYDEYLLISREAQTNSIENKCLQEYSKKFNIYIPLKG